MLGIVNKLVKTYLDFRLGRIKEMWEAPLPKQQEVFINLLFKGRHTAYGRRYGFDQIDGYKAFTERVPIVTYEEVREDIQRMIMGEPDILWPGQTLWYAKSSGTTSVRSKYIPVTQDHLKGCIIKSSWDAVAMLYNMKPEAQLFAEKSLVMGGSIGKFGGDSPASYGDVSGIMIHHLPLIGRPFYTPDQETALLEDWEEKIQRMAYIVKDEQITMFGGVPTWTLVLFERLLELTGKSHMGEVWPDAGIYMHGGVNFAPYRQQFDHYFPDRKLMYQQIYNASEGFFAAQATQDVDDMMLLLDNGIFYEFIPYVGHAPVGDAIPLEDVKEEQTYALVMSSNNGLWRYQPGDLVVFTSTAPYRLRVVGRTAQYINAFGEEVMVHNTDTAIAVACQQMDVVVREYSVGPVYLDQTQRGGHEWLVEFDRPPADLQAFAKCLDHQLKQLNSDYEAKRSHALALEELTIKVLPVGTFHQWLKSEGKFGGQHKVPRLSNDRRYVDAILAFAEAQTAIGGR